MGKLPKISKLVIIAFLVVVVGVVIRDVFDIVVKTLGLLSSPRTEVIIIIIVIVIPMSLYEVFS